MVNRFTIIAYYPSNHNYNFLKMMKGDLTSRFGDVDAHCVQMFKKKTPKCPV